MGMTTPLRLNKFKNKDGQEVVVLKGYLFGLIPVTVRKLTQNETEYYNKNQDGTYKSTDDKYYTERILQLEDVNLKKIIEHFSGANQSPPAEQQQSSQGSSGW